MIKAPKHLTHEGKLFWTTIQDEYSINDAGGGAPLAEPMEPLRAEVPEVPDLRDTKTEVQL